MHRELTFLILHWTKQQSPVLDFTRQEKLINVTQCARCALPRHWITSPINVWISRDVVQSLVQFVWNLQVWWRKFVWQAICREHPTWSHSNNVLQFSNNCSEQWMLNLIKRCRLIMLIQTLLFRQMRHHSLCVLQLNKVQAFVNVLGSRFHCESSAVAIVCTLALKSQVSCSCHQDGAHHSDVPVLGKWHVVPTTPTLGWCRSWVPVTCEMIILPMSISLPSSFTSFGTGIVRIFSLTDDFANHFRFRNIPTGWVANHLRLDHHIASSAVAVNSHLGFVFFRRRCCGNCRRCHRCRHSLISTWFQSGSGYSRIHFHVKIPLHASNFDFTSTPLLSKWFSANWSAHKQPMFRPHQVFVRRCISSQRNHPRVRQFGCTHFLIGNQSEYRFTKNALKWYIWSTKQMLEYCESWKNKSSVTNFVRQCSSSDSIAWIPVCVHALLRQTRKGWVSSSPPLLLWTPSRVPLLLNWPLDNGVAARKIGHPLSANSNNILSAILSQIPCGISSFIEYHLFSEPGPMNDHCPFPNLVAYKNNICQTFFFIVFVHKECRWTSTWKKKEFFLWNFLVFLLLCTINFWLLHWAAMYWILGNIPLEFHRLTIDSVKNFCNFEKIWSILDFRNCSQSTTHNLKWRRPMKDSPNKLFPILKSDLAQTPIS